MSRQGERSAEFERSARFWLRAFPRRWRAEHGDEVLGVLADLAMRGERRVGVRTAANLVRSGWATRWRGHPPVHRWLGYRLLDLSLPRRCRGWLADDIDGALYLLRRAVWSSWPLLAVLATRVAAPGGTPMPMGFWWYYPPGFAVVVALTSRRARRLAREKHLVAEPGEPLLPGTYVAMGAPFRRVPADWAVSRLLAVLGALVVLAVPATVLAPAALLPRPFPGSPGAFEIVVGPVGWIRWVLLGLLVAAQLVGSVLAVRASRLIGDRLRELPPQPERELKRPSRWVDAALVALVAVVAVAAWAEATGATVVWLSPVAAVVGLTVLPRTLVLRRAADVVGGRAPDGTQLAWTDLTWVGRYSRPVWIDRNRSVVRQWDGPYVPGQVVLGPVSDSEPPWPDSEPPWPPVRA